MAKALFRHLRGELNGFYLTSLYNTLNRCTENIKVFLMNTKNKQFKNGYISTEDLYGLGKFAGIFLPRVSMSDALTSLYMTDSYVFDGVQYSERGLFYLPLETFNYYHLNLNAEGFFEFVRTTQEEYDDDINTLALFNKRSSLVGDEKVIGYVSDTEENLISSDGTIDMSKVSATPPKNGAYNRIYGDEFCFLSEGTEESMDKSTRMVLSESEVVDDEEYSERGLWHTPAPDFPDINTLANEKERSSLVGDEEIIGYIPASATDIFDDEGNVKEEVILSSPPVSGAYSDFYGNKFLFLAEGVTIYTEVDASLYIELYKALQIVRYNGASIKSLCDIIEILCPNGLITISKIEVGVDGRHINVYYNYVAEVEGITYKQQRLSLLDYLVTEKFKQVLMVENEI